jgi:tRNA (cmo5U34)-methyltransferase
MRIPPLSIDQSSNQSTITRHKTQQEGLLFLNSKCSFGVDLGREKSYSTRVVTINPMKSTTSSSTSSTRTNQHYTIVVALCASAFTSLVTFYLTQQQHSKHNKNKEKEGKKEEKGEGSKEIEKHNNDYDISTDQKTLGPAQKPETLYQLNLRGKIDKIYECSGPKPFKFDEEVVSVFDDMVSRSVPLYCEVIDLAIYWVERYYTAGTRIYDLGCSTGTTIDVLARSLSNPGDNGTDGSDHKSSQPCHFIGVDNSEAMIQSCREKLEWAKKYHKVDLYCDNLMNIKIENASFVIMNYTLQFIPIVHRQELLSSINAGLCEGGIFLISEKVRAQCSELQETCTWIYEDFKQRRKYTKREIARKKEALMNVLIPFTEEEIRNNLQMAGFSSVEVIAKWNNFTTFIARKKPPVYSSNNHNNKYTSSKKKKKAQIVKKKISTPHLDALLELSPVYLSDLVNDSKLLYSLCLERIELFHEKGGLSNHNLKSYDDIAQMIQELPSMTSKKLIVNEDELTIGNADELTIDDMATLKKCVESLKPWKKGPLNLFGIRIDTEWRSDWKWKRLQKSLPDMKDKTVCDLGCGNGYFMYRMLEYEPKLVVGIDPNLHAFLEFKLFSRLSGVDNIQFEYLRGDVMSSFIGAFDVVYCLGVLYHTPDPIGMLKDIYKSMKGNAVSSLFCNDDDISLFFFVHFSIVLFV